MLLDDGGGNSGDDGDGDGDVCGGGGHVGSSIGFVRNFT